MAKKLPVTRTLEWLIDHGWMASRVDRHAGGISHDAFGCFDVAAKKRNQPGTLWVQCTDHTNHAARRKKLQQREDMIGLIVATGDQAEIWSWHPDKAEPRREVLAYPVTWPIQGGTDAGISD